jgi:hypothetical protein
VSFDVALSGDSARAFSVRAARAAFREAAGATGGAGSGSALAVCWPKPKYRDAANHPAASTAEVIQIVRRTIPNVPVRSLLICAGLCIDRTRWRGHLAPIFAERSAVSRIGAMAARKYACCKSGHAEIRR